MNCVAIRSGRDSCAGLGNRFAIGRFPGLAVMYQNDDAMLTQGMLIYDALYAWCASARGEQHGWPPLG